MTKTLFKQSGLRWAEATLTIKDGRLSITGAEGSVTTVRAARKMAIEYWESYLDESPEEMVRMLKDYGKRTARTAAKYIVETDGEFHGLDVHKVDGARVYLTESCGQIVDTLREWFPELIPALPWHLNDMHAECEHQEARGETYKTHPGAECPDCGYQLGSAWTKRDLPAEIVALVGSL